MRGILNEAWRKNLYIVLFMEIVGLIWFFVREEDKYDFFIVEEVSGIKNVSDSTKLSKNLWTGEVTDLVVLPKFCICTVDDTVGTYLKVGCLYYRKNSRKGATGYVSGKYLKQLNEE